MIFTQYSTMTVNFILVSTQQTDPNRKVVVSDLISGASQRTHRPVQSWKGLKDLPFDWNFSKFCACQLPIVFHCDRRSNRMPMKLGAGSSGPLSQYVIWVDSSPAKKMTFYHVQNQDSWLLVYSHETYHRKSVNPVEAFMRKILKSKLPKTPCGPADDSLSTSGTPHTPVMTELVLDVICASEHAKKFQSKHNIEKLQMLVHCFAACGLRSISLFSICADCKVLVLRWVSFLVAWCFAHGAQAPQLSPVHYENVSGYSMLLWNSRNSP